VELTGTPQNKGMKLTKLVSERGHQQAIVRLDHQSGVFVVVLLPLLLSACSDALPTSASTLSPSVQTSPSSTEQLPSANDRTFDVRGIVADERGFPLANVQVTMRHYLGVRTYAPSVQTDTSGAYHIEFTSTPYALGNDRAAARAEVEADGYEAYWRDVVATGSHLVENFPLRRRKQITAGDSIVLSLTNGNGSCLGWLRAPCDRVRVAVPADGTVTVVATPRPESVPSPEIQVCCADGNERYGNPVTLPVTGGIPLDVEVGQPPRPGSSTSDSVIVKTSFEPS
jgi:hypothetical protein